jgi:hypothetical protein
MQRAAFLSETQRIGAALDQANAQGLFQLGHAARQRRLRPPRGAAGATGAAMDRHKIEVGQRLQIYSICSKYETTCL